MVLCTTPGLSRHGPVKSKGPPQAQDHKQEENFFAIDFFPGPVAWPTVLSEGAAGTTWLALAIVPTRRNVLKPRRRLGSRKSFLRGCTTEMQKQ
eukprot:3021765-Amphidinium_carterae.1